MCSFEKSSIFIQIFTKYKTARFYFMFAHSGWCVLRGFLFSLQKKTYWFIGVLKTLYGPNISWSELKKVFGLTKFLWINNISLFHQKGSPLEKPPPCFWENGIFEKSCPKESHNKWKDLTSKIGKVSEGGSFWWKRLIPFWNFVRFKRMVSKTQCKRSWRAKEHISLS